MITFHIITIFPDIFDSYLGESIIKRAQEKGIIDIKTYDLRDFTDDTHRQVDDAPYGGGPGMVLKAEPILKAVESIGKTNAPVFIFSPSGEQFTNDTAEKFSKEYEEIILIAGRYEGIDARVKEILGVEELSIGPYTLTGGELPAMVVIDAVSRRIPGVLGKDESVEERRTASREVYTRPETLEWKGKVYDVPEVLRSGHHGEIEKWRKKKSGEN